MKEVYTGAFWRRAFRQRRGESSSTACGSQVSGKSSHWPVGCFQSWMFSVEKYLETGTKASLGAHLSAHVGT